MKMVYDPIYLYSCNITFILWVYILFLMCNYNLTNYLVLSRNQKIVKKLLKLFFTIIYLNQLSA